MAKSNHRWQGTIQYIADRSSFFALLYGGIILCLLVIGLSTVFGWPAYIPLALAIMLVLGYYLVAHLWAVHEITDRPGQQPVEILQTMSRMKAADQVVCIDLGLRDTAVALAQQLTTGKVYVIDVYNPQWNLSAALQRGRLRVRATPPAADPRLEWLDGEIRLLPLPDESVSAVFLNQILSEFWQREDREILLKESYRILQPGGKVLLAERVRSRLNLLVLGPTGWGLETADYWRDLLSKAGFTLRQEKDIQGLIHYFSAEKAVAADTLQLPLGLKLD